MAGAMWAVWSSANLADGRRGWVEVNASTARSNAVRQAERMRKALGDPQSVVALPVGVVPQADTVVGTCSDCFEVVATGDGHAHPDPWRIDVLDTPADGWELFYGPDGVPKMPQRRDLTVEQLAGALHAVAGDPQGPFDPRRCATCRRAHDTYRRVNGL